MSFCLSSISRKSRYFAALSNCARSFAPSGRGEPSRFFCFSLSLTFRSENPRSTSQTATRFSACASTSAFPEPIPPNPTIAMFSVSLGAWNPGPPRTWRGTIIGKPAGTNAAASADFAAVSTKSRRDGFFPDMDLLPMEDE